MINFYYSDEYLNHDTGSHPESIERIKVVNELLLKEYSNHNFYTPSLASKEIIANVHDIDYVNDIFNNIPISDFTYFDPDTIASPSSLKSYLSAVGGSVDAVDHILSSNKKKKCLFLCS